MVSNKHGVEYKWVLSESPIWRTRGDPWEKSIVNNLTQILCTFYGGSMVPSWAWNFAMLQFSPSRRYLSHDFPLPNLADGELNQVKCLGCADSWREPLCSCSATCTHRTAQKGISLSPTTLQWSYLVTCLLHWSTTCGNLASEIYCLLWLILDGRDFRITSSTPSRCWWGNWGSTCIHAMFPKPYSHLLAKSDLQPKRQLLSSCPTLLWFHHLVWNSSSLTHTGYQGQ